MSKHQQNHRPQPDTVFQIGDHVRYTGQGHIKHDLGANRVGEIVRRIKGYGGTHYIDAYCVEFGSDAYIINGASLARHTFKDQKEAGPVIEKILRKWNVNEEPEKR